MSTTKPYTFDRVIRFLLTAGIIIGLIELMGYLSDVLIPFAVALLLAYLINPLVVWVRKWVKNHTLAVLITLVVVILAAMGLASLIIPMIINEISHTGQVFSKLVTNSDLARRTEEILPENIWEWVQQLLSQSDVQDFFKTDKFWQILEKILRKLMPGVWGIITGTTSLLLGLVGLSVIGLYLVFLLMDFQKVRQGWQNLIPPSHWESISEFTQDFSDGMNRYFRGQALVAAIVGGLFAVGFYLIGLPLGILLGLFVGALNMVPYLQLIGIPPALLLALVHAIDVGGNIWLYLGLTGMVFALVQAIQDTILVPRIMGKVTGFSPAIILLSLSIWGKLLGMLGLIIALPMTALIYAYYRRFITKMQTETGERGASERGDG